MKALSVAAVCLAGHAVAQQPPKPERAPAPRTIHGQTLADDFRWLEKKEDPKVIDYLEAENAFFNARMEPLKELTEKVYDEMIGRLQETDEEVPVFDNGYWYSSRTEEGKDYPIYIRRRKGSQKWETLLDLNKLNEGQDFTSVGAQAISPDNRWLAYTVDHTGFEEYTLFVKDLRRPTAAPKKIGDAQYVEWAADSRTLFTVIEDEAKRPYRLYRQSRMGGPRTLVYEEKDPEYWFWIEKTRDGQYLLLNSATKDESEVSFIPSNRPTAKPTLISPRRKGHEYYADHREGWLYIMSNQPSAPNFRLVMARPSAPGEANWRQILAERDDVVLSSFSLFEDYLVLSERANGFTRLRVVDFTDGWKTRTIPTRDPVATIGLGANPDYHTESLRYTYESYTTNDWTMVFDPATGESKILKKRAVLGGYDETDYVTELGWATADDGTKIPVTWARHKSVTPSASSPVLLTGYGAYGSSGDPYFSSSRVSLMDRGVIFAQAHIRGGGEFGRAWYEGGKLANKKNTFTDFIAVADWLVEKGMTSRDRMVIEGGSAGGLLIGAVVNMRPDLCAGAHLSVPFVDVINTMLNDELPLTTLEYVEWGNPNVAEEFGWMMEYSPYDNIRDVEYPDMLVTSSINDSRVMYHEPAKWTAKVRTVSPQSDIMMRMTMAGGHGGASGRYPAYYDRAQEVAWMLDVMGIADGRG